MDNKTYILIVDDDQEIRDLLGKFLTQHGYHIQVAMDGKAMRQAIATTPEPFDLIVLDIMLPGEDGFALCRQLRATSAIPIIMLTAVTEETDRIIGLELGADDYLTKPFNPRELLARIKAILRRSHNDPVLQQNTSKQQIKTQNEVYRFASWTLDKTARHLFSPEEVEITLSSGEYELLLALVERPQHVLSRDQLLDLTRNRSAGPFDRSIDVQISRLRQKIETDPKKPTLIKTVRGGGYVFTAIVERIRCHENTSNS